MECMKPELNRLWVGYGGREVLWASLAGTGTSRGSRKRQLKGEHGQVLREQDETTK